MLAVIFVLSTNTLSAQDRTVSDKLKGKWGMTSKAEDAPYKEIWKFDGKYLFTGTTKPNDDFDKEKYSVQGSCMNKESSKSEPNKFYLNLKESELCFLIVMDSKGESMELYYMARGNHFSFKKVD
ncbi:hypothetical protein [Roseivirga misakiensis]|uniref:hypothetical protein n=1 Tax=Roseivirga misakiensis TaxID=1563681 RepID=UPI00114CC4CE|nr:hypothetical protein [Roseivirga misakiensis]